MASRETENNSGEGEPQRNNSVSSLKNVVSSLKKVTRTDSKKGGDPSSSMSPSPEAAKIPLDTLPDTRTGLEGRLNHHLSELDYLRRIVRNRNDEIKDACSRAAYQHRLRPTVPCSVHMLDETILTLRHQRNGMARYAEFHQNEIRRIADKRRELDAAQGLECTVYQMYIGFQREAEWAQLFSI